MPRDSLGADAHLSLAEKHAAHNSSPLPVVARSASGAWITARCADELAIDMHHAARDTCFGVRG
ncbi:hypothetical protein HQO90_24895 [Rhodococcus fascians]|nr:hypothetical protein [Rhodococcus fascians]